MDEDGHKTAKYNVIHTHNGLLLSHKGEGVLPFVATWMDLEGMVLSEISQTKTNAI